MACILTIETATDICSVCVAKDQKVIFERENINGPSHATVLGAFVQEAIQYISSISVKLDAVAVSCGPGSYTGLRIGVSEAKGLCYGLSIPLIAINTLQIMAFAVTEKGLLEQNVLLCPMIDARRMEVYDAIYDQQLKTIRATGADIIDQNSFAELLVNNKIAFFGNGSAKVKTELCGSNSLFIDDIYPHATNMVKLAFDAYNNKIFVDVAYFEPFYLKEFVATTPKNKILPQV